MVRETCKSGTRRRSQGGREECERLVPGGMRVLAQLTAGRGALARSLDTRKLHG